MWWPFLGDKTVDSVPSSNSHVIKFIVEKERHVCSDLTKTDCFHVSFLPKDSFYRVFGKIIYFWYTYMLRPITIVRKLVLYKLISYKVTCHFVNFSFKWSLLNIIHPGYNFKTLILIFSNTLILRTSKLVR